MPFFPHRLQVQVCFAQIVKGGAFFALRFSLAPPCGRCRAGVRRSLYLNQTGKEPIERDVGGGEKDHERTTC